MTTELQAKVKQGSQVSKESHFYSKSLSCIPLSKTVLVVLTFSSLTEERLQSDFG